jgi:hypothetical protein
MLSLDEVHVLILVRCLGPPDVVRVLPSGIENTQISLDVSLSEEAQRVIQSHERPNVFLYDSTSTCSFDITCKLKAANEQHAIINFKRSPPVSQASA